jgi:tetratricopeptide (TPR) repeat protein
VSAAVARAVARRFKRYHESMRTRTHMHTRLLTAVITATSLSACALRGPLPPGAPPSGPSPSGTAQPAPPTPEQPSPAPPERPAAPAARQFHLGPAASALVTQAHTQAGGGDYGQAAATLERALRIEPDNPLLWIELGRVRLGENNAAQADAMGRKALALATGDAGAQAAAWRLIADSLRALGRNPEAAEAEGRAGSLAPR